MTDAHDAPRRWELTDIPGIGPGLADRLHKTGVFTIDDFKSAPLDEISAVHGISRQQARDMKAFCRVFRGREGRLDTTSEETIWRDSARDIQRRLRHQLDQLAERSKERRLKKKFASQLEKLSGVLERLPSQPPVDEEQRRKILKHLRALEKLLANAALLEPDDGLHQKVMRDRIRFRRKKLDKWIGKRVSG